MKHVILIALALCGVSQAAKAATANAYECVVDATDNAVYTGLLIGNGTSGKPLKVIYVATTDICARFGGQLGQQAIVAPSSVIKN